MWDSGYYAAAEEPLAPNRNPPPVEDPLIAPIEVDAESERALPAP